MEPAGDVISSAGSDMHEPTNQRRLGALKRQECTYSAALLDSMSISDD